VKPFLAILAGLVVATPSAWAQVTINQAALDQLAGIPPVVITAPPVLRQAPHKVTYRPVVHHHVAASPTILASSSMPKPVPLPKAAPSAPIAEPVVAKPVVPMSAAPKPVPPPANVEVVFAAGAADLPPGTSAELKAFCAKPAPAGFITIDAYAAADPNDPSVAPRLSLSRAFALRDALVACGVPSASIIPRADGVGKNPDIAQVSVAP
jgi:hypothetical protein